jgi:excisionase family DNA binding protein
MPSDLQRPPELMGRCTYMDTCSLCNKSTRLMTPLSVSLREASRLTGLSQRTLRRLVANGTLPSRKIGARRVISFDALARLVS